ncbi:tRNA 2-selenouridine(34) synthase MnmH [Shewanella sp. Choline-02u-19]|jgi:tRNA 2-selenouridine synthase|uniref:tRNA 2-selenouridine(34) synthase MnmH n=1 Tax=unclassified Shewanella TaxID=196818 RepID=UPI000C3411EC|nr:MULTISPECIES: tRNA 2-selenouridine(34) synthase MnmH [unclassified Shewanella]PKG58493.1 tRNA 2-selenouridine(34) synthase MnmH [Shewanella sp. GutDb-MelDb]PKG74592.1 tRNA 2-selenouridine(34) synthase MnmH [Shewanella sp. GutCb]PKH55989.1 tRNA 2-selenouridine(34) synthase MnmH [Shewanella sp. Bg11-22]PKI30579.1 tRNA 2-selenouridine(34) synthase MnmH [Shewanella sp. Choline-02u-19]
MPLNIVSATEYRRILVSDHPIMDVRAPVEFDKGAFLGSTNHPLMEDEERKLVGTCYKAKGQEAAIALGHSLVGGEIKQQRVDTWLRFFTENPNAYLYCFRGGLRSQLTQQWLKEAGIDVPFIEGGYKAMRQFLIETIDNAPSQKPMLILSGITGSGKTDFLLARNDAVDLEGIAHHRGSSFGRYHEPQPTQINFENALAVALLKHQDSDAKHLLLEDESFLIGRSALPKPFYNGMQAANIVVLEEPLEARLTRLLNEYVHKMHSGYIERLGEEAGYNAFAEYLALSITGIKKRLGGKQHDEFQAIITNALNIQQSRGDTTAHLEWIELLLSKYYDPMYQYQIDKKAERILFKGNHAEVHQWLDAI